MADIYWVLSFLLFVHAIHLFIIDYAVLQGCVLGPILFLCIYHACTCYADDTLICLSLKKETPQLSGIICCELALHGYLRSMRRCFSGFSSRAFFLRNISRTICFPLCQAVADSLIILAYLSVEYWCWNSAELMSWEWMLFIAQSQPWVVEAALAITSCCGVVVKWCRCWMFVFVLNDNSMCTHTHTHKISSLKLGLNSGSSGSNL